VDGGFISVIFCLLMCSLSIIGETIVLGTLPFKSTRRLSIIVAIFGLIVGIIITITSVDFKGLLGAIFINQEELATEIKYYVFTVIFGMCSGFGLGSVSLALIIFPVAGIIALIRSSRKK
jgi:hypothetical protein